MNKIAWIVIYTYIQAGIPVYIKYYNSNLDLAHKNKIYYTGIKETLTLWEKPALV